MITPGSTTAIVVRNTLMGGRIAGLTAALGAAAANTSHATAAGLGLAVVFARWPIALAVLRVAGACYLAWLGVASVLRVIRHADGGLALIAPSAARPGLSAHGGSFRQGLTANLLNPAIATFYLVVVPSFIPAGAPQARFAVLAAIHVTMALVCHSVWALALDALRPLLRPAAARRALEAATGLALIFLAARVLTR